MPINLRIPPNRKRLSSGIAACCMAVGGSLVARDHHFDHVEQIDKIVLS